MWLLELNETSAKKIEFEEDLLREIHPNLRCVSVQFDEFRGEPCAVTTLLPSKGYKHVIASLTDDGWKQTDEVKAGKIKILFFTKKI